MKHYICTSCGAVSESLKTCDTEGCALRDHEMTECNCVDGRHGKLLGDIDQPEV